MDFFPITGLRRTRRVQKLPMLTRRSCQRGRQGVRAARSRGRGRGRSGGDQRRLFAAGSLFHAALWRTSAAARRERLRTAYRRISAEYNSIEGPEWDFLNDLTRERLRRARGRYGPFAI